MIEQMEYAWSWLDIKLNQRLGQRGAEMVEYAVILSIIAVLAVWFYSDDAPNGSGGTLSKQKTLQNVVGRLWEGIKNNIVGL